MGTQKKSDISTTEKTRVLVVDDSPLMCRVITDILNKDSEITVAATARSGEEALKAAASNNFDVCTLDVHMPGMSGITVLKHLMVKSPIPTLMVSAFTSEGARTTFDALRYGAVDFFHKPSRDSGKDMQDQSTRLCSKVKRVAKVQVSAARYLRLKRVSINKDDLMQSYQWNGKSIAIIRASTGGYSSLISLLPMLKPGLSLPVIVSLGIQSEHLDAFINYIKDYVPFQLLRPEKDTVIERGKLYFLSQDECASFDKESDNWIMTITARQDFTDIEGPVDLILFGASENFHKGTLFVSLSGDGVQGISGAKEVIRNQGAVYAQAPKTCLSPGLSRKMFRETNCQLINIPEISHKINVWDNN